MYTKDYAPAEATCTNHGSLDPSTLIISQRFVHQRLRWNVLNGACSPVQDHVVWEPVNFLDAVIVDVGITDPNRAQILILD